MAKPSKHTLHHGKMGAAITVSIEPGAKKDEIVDISKQGMVTIRLRAKNEAEKVNQAVIAFLSETFGCEAKNIEVIAGQDRLMKLVTIVDMDVEMVQEKVMSGLKPR